MAPVTYDEALADRVREAVAARLEDGEEPGERRMFGGLALLVDGRMAAAVSGGGGLMVRVDPTAAPALAEQDGVAPVVMRGRPTRGWLLVAPALLGSADELGRWVARGVEAARAAGS